MYNEPFQRLYSWSERKKKMEEKRFRGPLSMEELKEVFAEIRMP